MEQPPNPQQNFQTFGRIEVLSDLKQICNCLGNQGPGLKPYYYKKTTRKDLEKRAGSEQIRKRKSVFVGRFSKEVVRKKCSAIIIVGVILLLYVCPIMTEVPKDTQLLI